LLFFRSLPPSLLLFAAAPMAAPADISAPVLYWNGVLHTMAPGAGGDAHECMPTALLTHLGRIAHIGSLADCEAAAARLDTAHSLLRVDLRGHCVLPGFVASHEHPAADANAFDWVDLRTHACASIEAGLAAVRARCELEDQRASATDAGAGTSASNAARPWVVGFGFDDTTTLENRDLLRSELDAACPTRPCMVWHISFHRLYFNTEALLASGLEVTVADPPGGHFSRNADGTVSGSADEAAIQMIKQHRPSVPQLVSFFVVREARECEPPTQARLRS